MPFSTVNPTTGETIATYNYATANEVEQTLSALQSAGDKWSKEALAVRQKFLLELAGELRKAKEPLAQSMTLEMGKTITEARAEVEKCAGAAEYYSMKAEEWLKPETLQEANFTAQVIKEPMGVVLAIMPWNFPCWQVIRFAVPALLVGNTALLKHAEITAGTATLLCQVFHRAQENIGFGQRIFAEIRLSHEQVASVIGDSRIQAVTFTGSVRGGKQVAEVAGRALKKSVMELGGSDAYIVLADADVSLAAKVCAQGRLQNAGQSCVAAKRFFVHQSVSQTFKDELSKLFSNWKMGEPKLDSTQMGPLAHKKFQTQVHEQVRNQLEQKQARVLLGGHLLEGPGAYYPASILEMKNIQTPWTEELFGPVACVWNFQAQEEVIHHANNSIFGLGGAVFSKDLKRAEEVAKSLRCGFVAINDMVKSDARVPFGGQKSSGYGRELSHYGLMEFVNVKTITGVGPVA